MKGKNVNVLVDFKLRICRLVVDVLFINLKYKDSEMYKIIVNFSVFDLKERVLKYGGFYIFYFWFVYYLFLIWF